MSDVHKRFCVGLTLSACLLGCFEPLPVGTTAWKCETDRDCPGANQRCADNQCVAADGNTDADFGRVEDMSNADVRSVGNMTVPDSGCDASNCQSGRCDGVGCLPCAANGDLNDGGRTPVCGGSCPPCTEGLPCLSAEDCISGVCTNNECAAPVCRDEVINGAETDVDCGGDDCEPCAVGQVCAQDSDCDTAYCSGGVCTRPLCENNDLDEGETDVDCGGLTCGRCDGGEACIEGPDCTSLVCVETNMDRTCAPTCRNGERDGDETDLDCGGSCPPCGAGLACIGAADCISGVCTNNECAAPTCNDEVMNGTETGVDCGGTCRLRCNIGEGCVTNEDCPQRGHCSIGGFCVSDTCGNGEFQADNGEECDGDAGLEQCRVEAGCFCNAECKLVAPCPAESLQRCRSQFNPVQVLEGESGAQLGWSLATHSFEDRDAEGQGFVKLNIGARNYQSGIARRHGVAIILRTPGQDNEPFSLFPIGALPFLDVGINLGQDQFGWSVCSSAKYDAAGGLRHNEDIGAVYLDALDDGGIPVNERPFKLEYRGACGNDVRETGEGCDDGNLSDGDGCASSCVSEAASCSDGVQNNGETGVDCGGGCEPCDNLQACGTHLDCQSGLCVEDQCQPCGPETQQCQGSTRCLDGRCLPYHVENFGSAVACNNRGDMAIGAYGRPVAEDSNQSAGRLYLTRASAQDGLESLNTNMVELAKEDTRWFGYRAAMNDEYLLVGAEASPVERENQRLPLSGRAFIYDLDSTDASGRPAVAELTAGDQANIHDRFGSALAIGPNIGGRGTQVFVGAYNDASTGSIPFPNGVDDSLRLSERHFGNGAVHVFRRPAADFQHAQKLMADRPIPGENFGFSIASTKGQRPGDHLLVIGAPAFGVNALERDYGRDHVMPMRGAVYVFQYSNLDNRWEQIARLEAPAELAQAGSLFGLSVAVTDELIIVGAPYALDNPQLAQNPDNRRDGRVFVYSRAEIERTDFDCYVSDPSRCVPLYEVK